VLTTRYPIGYDATTHRGALTHSTGPQVTTNPNVVETLAPARVSTLHARPVFGAPSAQMVV
jgi:hypothetical protein